MLRRIATVASFAALSIYSANAFAQNTVRWSSASSNGNGCPPGTASVSTAGNEIAWVFNSFYFDLINPESASRFCRLTATATLAQGFYIANLNQTLSYAGVKSTFGSRLSVAAVSRFFGYSLPVIQDNYPNGTPFNSPYEELQSNTLFGVIAPPSWWCGTRPPQGLFQSTLSATGQVFPGGGSLSFAGQGFNVKFEAIAGWLACTP
jgi:hypothetical protein